ncbi:N-acylethanolamine-hydrolyzing acid amidase isoform X3 [Tyto alba]|uniref:N-acylethanolamine-hydrolyzing acid amidase isoform X3 n=1 Tax=Tyto alba TaxID=56313 RepID=UPI001C66DD0B|nr:N-acylethanolamine-hydrolyzing acid amidase isoform X3 [Tyto alba]
MARGCGLWGLLALLCGAGAGLPPAPGPPPAPPRCNVSLDSPAEERWLPALRRFDPAFLRAAVARVIDESVPKWVHEVIRPIAAELEFFMPQPFAGEILGLCKALGISLGDGVLLNFAYESTAFCTSIVAQDDKGNIYHGRNLDYDFVDILSKITIDVQFIKSGQIAYQGTTFLGYVGLWTGQSPHKFTISGDERGGVSPKEGMVITRNRRGPADLWPLDPLGGAWFRVETNYDHWTTPPPFDDRRTPAIKALNATGQQNMNFDALFKVLSVKPVLNNNTVYTTVMSAALPEKYQTWIRTVK